MSLKTTMQLKREIKARDKRIEQLEMTISSMRAQEIVRSSEALFRTDALFKLCDFILTHYRTSGEINREWERFKNALDKHGNIQSALEALDIELEISMSDATDTVMNSWNQSLQ